MIQIDDLDSEIAEYMSNYFQDVTDGVKKAVDTVSKEANDEIKKQDRKSVV